MKIDEFMPEYQFNEIHQVKVEADPEKIFLAIKMLLPKELPFWMFALFALRALPAKLMGKAKADTNDLAKPFLSQMTEGGFMLLSDTSPEIVLGLIGQFWKIVAGKPVVLKDPASFKSFQAPEYGKVAANLMVKSLAGKTMLTTETRVWVPNAKVRRKFWVYWLIISWASGWIRMMWLKAIKRRAEKN
jgi:hypothetical protein